MVLIVDERTICSDRRSGIRMRSPRDKKLGSSWEKGRRLRTGPEGERSLSVDDLVGWTPGKSANRTCIG